MKQVNTWGQYLRWLSRERLAWHVQAQVFVLVGLRRDVQGAGHACSHHCARQAMQRGMVKFGPAMRRWLSGPKTDFPPGWKGPRQPWRLNYL